MIKAVVFDLDGVLIDSEPVYLEIEYQNIKRYLPQITKQQMMLTVGMSSKMLKEFTANLLHMDLSSPEFEAYRRAAYENVKIDYQSIVRKNAKQTLKKLKQMNYRLALASSGDLKDILKVLEEIDCKDYFEVICSGDMFHQSKPNPEIYLTTFAKLGLKSEECMVVEDSQLGLTAALASKAVVCCMKENRFLFTQPKTDYQIDDLSQIISILAQQVKAIYFDIDGTLTDMTTHHMVDSTKYALEKLREKGIKLFLCTGRSVFELKQTQMIDESLFDGAIYMNGQYCVVDHQVVSDHPLTNQQLLKINQFVAEKDVSCVYFTADDSFVNKVDQRLIEVQAEIGTPIPAVKNQVDWKQEKIYQLCPSLIAQEEQEFIQQVEGIKTTRWASKAIDVVEKSGGKDRGILAINRHFSLDPRETMTFGDGENDLSMYKVSLLNVAMGNAVETLKQNASYVTDRIENDGLYKALQYFSILD